MSKTTDLLEQQADLLFENVSGWEQRTLERIGRRIKKMGEMPLYDVKAINLMAETKGEMEAIIKDLAKITGQNIQDVQKMYAQALESQHLENQPLYDYQNKTFVPFSENKELQSLVKAYSKSTGETMINLSKTKALGFIDKIGNFKNMQDTIYDVFGKAAMTVATGAGDFHTAMRDAIEQLGGSGIRVHYGSGVTRRLDTVVRQNILWGAKQANVAYTEMIGEELDCDGIEIDYHSNPRPSHEFMQGKQYSLVGKKTINGVTYESADEALERLQDYGCLHYKTPIILGISEPRYSDKELAELKRQDQEQKTVTFEKQVNGETVKTTMSKTGYEWSQNMRMLETEARKEKEIISALKASGDNIGAKQHRQRLNTINKKYNEIAEQTGIPARLDRMSIVKGGSRAGNIKFTLENSGENGILKDSGNNIIKITQNSINNIPVIKTDSMSEQLAYSLQNRHKEVLEMASNLPDNTEVGMVCDINGNMIKPVEGEHGKGNVKLPKLNYPYIAIHNHPSGKMHSHTDLQKLLFNENQIISSVVGNNGNVYLFKKSDSFDGFACYNAYYNNALPKFKEAIAQNDLESYFKVMDEFIKECKKYGIEFNTGTN